MNQVVKALFTEGVFQLLNSPITGDNAPVRTIITVMVVALIAIIGAVIATIRRNK